MPAAKRPTKSKALEVLVITVTSEGTERSFEFRPTEITAKITRLVRQATGHPIVSAMAMMETEPDLDVLVAICYAAALQSDIATDFDQLEALFTYDAEYEVAGAPEPVGDADPEA